jgi:hypothetical protein
MKTVEVHVFRSGGKFYTSERIEWKNTDARGKVMLNVDAFKESILSSPAFVDGKRVRMAGMTAVVIDPPCEYSYPLMLTIPESRQETLDTRLNAKEEAARAAMSVIHLRDRGNERSYCLAEEDCKSIVSIGRVQADHCPITCLKCLKLALLEARGF